MLKLNLSKEPKWIDLVPGVRLKCCALTTAIMVQARADPAVQAVPGDARDEDRGFVFAQALGRIVILEWEGVGDEEGEVLPASPENIDTFLEVWPIFEAFQERVVSRALLLESEKNV